MNIHLADRKLYPNLVRYIKNQLPKVKWIPKISNALLKNGEIKKKSLAFVLAWGTPPIIRVVHMLKNQCGEFSPNCRAELLLLRGRALRRPLRSYFN